MRQSMTDKIKVWKCEECMKRPNAEDIDPCYSNHDIQCTFNPNWQPITDYQITPTGSMAEIFGMIPGRQYFCEVIERGDNGKIAKCTDIQTGIESGFDFGKYEITEPFPAQRNRKAGEIPEILRWDNSDQPTQIDASVMGVTKDQSQEVFSEIEKQAIIATAAEICTAYPIAFDGIINTITKIGPIHSKGGNIDSLIACRDDLKLANINIKRMSAKLLSYQFKKSKENARSALEPQTSAELVNAILSKNDLPQKYRLKIQLPITEIDHVVLAYKLRNWGTTIDYGIGHITSENFNFHYNDIPKHWLTAIPIEPELSEAEKWLKDWDKYDHISNFKHKTIIKSFCIVAHEAGQKLIKDRHQLFLETFSKYIKNDGVVLSDLTKIFREMEQP